MIASAPHTYRIEKEKIRQYIRREGKMGCTGKERYEYRKGKERRGMLSTIAIAHVGRGAEQNKENKGIWRIESTTAVVAGDMKPKIKDL